MIQQMRPIKVFKFTFSRCRCRLGLVDCHGQKSSDIVKTSWHETMMILPLDQTNIAVENERRRTSQAFPGSIDREFWRVMQSTSTRDGLLIYKILFSNQFLLTLTCA